MGRSQCKNDENTKNQNASPPPRDHNFSPARDQRWMENESDELTETGFRRPNLRLIGGPECDGENESKLENTLQNIIQENFSNLARQATIQVQEI
ncbi:LINE-1 retrotransposable element ORF1 protein [Plecturocebus cupreus]